MKIQPGDVIGLEGEISGVRVIGLGPCGLDLADGRQVRLSDVFCVRSDNEDGTATETFSDGRVRKVELD